MSTDPELASVIVNFKNCYENGALEQLEGLLATTVLTLLTLKNAVLYWIMTGDEALVDIHNPADPKILCLGNDVEAGTVFSTPLALISQAIFTEIDRRGGRETALIFDELPTLYLSELTSLMARARANKIAICLSVQDLTQLEIWYGKEKANSLFELSKTILSGRVIGPSAQRIADRLNKNLASADRAWYWPLFRSSGSKETPQLLPGDIEALPYGHFVGEVSTVGESGPVQTGFFARIPSTNSMDSDNTAGLPANPELAHLTNE